MRTTRQKNSQKHFYGLIYFFFFQFGSWDHVCDRLSASEKSGAKRNNNLHFYSAQKGDVTDHLFQSIRHCVFFLLSRHPEIWYFDDVVLADEAIPGGKISMDAILLLQVLHSGWCIQTHAWLENENSHQEKVIINLYVTVWNFFFLSFMVWTVKWITRKHFIVKLIFATKQDFFISRPLKVEKLI